MRLIDQLLLKKSTIIITFILDSLIGLVLLANYFEDKVIDFLLFFKISPELTHNICYISGCIAICIIPMIFGWIAYRIYQDNAGSSHTIIIGGIVGIIITFFLHIILFLIIGWICLLLFIPMGIFTIIYKKTHQDEL